MRLDDCLFSTKRYDQFEMPLKDILHAFSKTKKKTDKTEDNNTASTNSCNLNERRLSSSKSGKMKMKKTTESRNINDSKIFDKQENNSDGKEEDIVIDDVIKDLYDISFER